MWSPTHIQVTVQKAKGLLTKGKNGTNNCFVTIVLGKEKYQTSIVDKAPDTVEWHEECELAIPEHGNRAELVLTCLHHNAYNIDEFLGQITLPLNEMDVYERTRSRWFKLQSKPGQEKKSKERGELEVRVAFTVKAGSLTDLTKKEKHKSSIGQLASSVGGSLLSMGEKRKGGLKKFAKSLGSKVHISGRPKKEKTPGDGDSITGSFTSIGGVTGGGGVSGGTPGSGQFQTRRSRQTIGDADPGVISEDEDEFVFDNLSAKSSGSSLNVARQPPVATISPISEQFELPPTIDEDRISKSMTLPMPAKPPRAAAPDVPSVQQQQQQQLPSPSSQPPKVDEWEAKLYGKNPSGSSDSLKRRSWEPARVPLVTAAAEDTESVEVTMAPPQPASPKSPASVVDRANLVAAPPHQQQQQPQQPDAKPKPLPRVGTLESINEKEPPTANAKKSTQKADKDSSKAFTKKFKYFIKGGELKAGSVDDLRATALINPKQFGERIIIGHENDAKALHKPIELSPEILHKYDGKSRQEVINMAHGLETEVQYQKAKIKELEDYLDNLLLRVMETHPKILQNPYVRSTTTKSG